MKEEIIVSGRMNPGVDPVLHIWGWEIAVYLFLGGLAAGLLIYATFFSFRNKQNDLKTTVCHAPMLVPLLLIVGLFALFMDLSHKLFFWQLYTTIRLQSPMSWGAWTLLAVTPLSIAWCAIQLKTIFPVIHLNKSIYKLFRLIIIQKDTTSTVNWEWKYKWLIILETYLNKNIKIFSGIILLLSIILGIYTGILLSAFNARPLWNTSILGPLFLTSGLSAAAAVIILLTKNQYERNLFGKIDLVLILVELFLITHIFMGFLASTQVQIDAAHLFLGGPFTLVFWIFVVFLGLILPAIIEILHWFDFHIPHVIPAILVIIGGIVLRFLIVYAGQASRYLY